MSTTVKIQFNSQQILDNRGLGTNKKAQQFFCNEVWRMSDPYTSMDSSTLKSNVSLSSDGSSITYNSPYARYQWYGEAMSGNPRTPNGKALNYAGAPMRGKEWTKRMWADRGKEVLQGVTSITGGKVG